MAEKKSMEYRTEDSTLHSTGTAARKLELADLKQSVQLLQLVAATTKLEKRGDEYWGCCPFHNEKTPSFAIKVKKGEQVFFCQGCSKGGDVIRFIEYRDGCTTGAAIETLKRMCGEMAHSDYKANVDFSATTKQVVDTFIPLIEEKEKKIFPADKWPPFEKALQHNVSALKWLLDERGISAETAATLRLGFIQSCKGFLPPDQEAAREKGWVMFPRLHENKLLAVKMRSIYMKAFSQWAGMDAKALFNLDTINALEAVYVTEGEFDTAIFEQAGFRAVSIPNANTKLTPEMRIALKGAASIFLAGDNDGSVGNAAMKQLARELGENTALIVWPNAKDANEFFLKVCNRDIGKFKEAIADLGSKALNTPIEGFTSLLARLRSTDGSDAGADPNRLHMPFEAMDQMNYNPPGSIVVLYSTYSGTGKTILATQIMLHEAKRGEVVVVYSPEVRDAAYLALVASQTIGVNRALKITKDQYEETANILDIPTERGGSFTYYVGHALPDMEPDAVLGFFEAAIRATGATRFVVDTLHRVISVGPRDNMAQAEGRMVKCFDSLAEKYGTIFILVGQSNKEAEDLKEARRDAEGVLRGSRELQDVAYGVYLLHRKRKTGQEGTDILDFETNFILKKDRGKGPGSAFVKLLFRPQSSKFVLLDTTAPPGGEPPLVNDEDSPL